MHGNQANIMDQAAAFYGKALRQLSARIQDEGTRYDHENVSAMMALHLYEVSRSQSSISTTTDLQTIIYSNRSGWIEHAGGTGRLIEMKGPEKHQDLPNHA